jgi:hypothetical protein
MDEASDARKILSKYNIGINSHWNGVYLPTRNAAHGTIHLGKHNSDVIKAINQRIIGADTKGGKVGVLRELQKIRNELASGNISL